MDNILQRNTCYNIVTCEKHICILGNGIGIYNKHDFKLIYRINDMRNCFSAVFIDEDNVVVKNTLGTYNIYNISTQTCVKTINIKEQKKEAQDTEFILSHDNYFIYDIISTRVQSQKKLFIIDIMNDRYDSIELFTDTRLPINLQYDHISKAVLFMHTMPVDGNAANDITYITGISLIDHKLINVYDHLGFNNNRVILFFNNKYLLREDMSVIDIYTNNIVKFINFNYDRMKYGYFCKTYISNDNKYLYMIFSKKIIVIDYSDNSIVFEYSDNYCSCAKIIGNKILIGTWEKVVLLDFT